MNNHDQEIKDVIDRNKRVEGDKAWEVSWFRKILIAIITYIAACIILTISSGDHTRAYLPALVPSVAYLLSTISIGHVKNWWIKSRYRG
ncbi:MAG: hypothetical protein QF442_00925 [Candidatus Peribacteraceae bacterium]|jgi:hypothetical protein|nr:hypothetical protein [Candidatus Peribacteraceae bacterium]